MKKFMWTIVIMVMGLCTISVMAARPYKFVALQYGRFTCNFKTENTRVENNVTTEKLSFNDKYRSNEFGLQVGDHMIFDQMYFVWGGEASLMTGNYTLAKASNTVKYKSDYAFGLFARPGIYLHERLGFYLHLAFKVGNFRFQKTATTTTSYDSREHLMGYALGAGFVFQINECWGTTIDFTHTQYASTTINATHGAGAAKKIDTLKLTPSYQAVRLGVFFKF